MNFLKKFWKVLVAVVLILIAVLLLYTKYLPQKTAYESQRASLNTVITSLQIKLAQNQKYADLYETIPSENEQLIASRQELYSHFPAELLEEDQIMYVIYLEELFGTEIHFNFGTTAPIQVLQDGAILNGLTLTVNYRTTYEGFKEMVNYLATDSRITSVQYATMEYDEVNDIAVGYLTLLCYTLDSSMVDYQSPDVGQPETGKDNIFD